MVRGSLPVATCILLTLLRLLADIVRARIRTMGVEEHKFVMETSTHPVAFREACICTDLSSSGRRI